MLTPLTILLLTLTVFPFGYSVLLSFTDSSALSPVTHFIGARNYTDLLGNAAFWSAVRVTIVFTVLAVGIEIALGVGVALALNGLAREHRLLSACTIIPMAATPVAVLFGWKVMLDPTLGVINYLLSLIGLPQPDWLGTPTGALATLVMVDVWMWTPFVIVILMGALAALPAELIEASHIDGANWIQRFRFVIVPHLRPFLIVAVLFRGIDSLKIFDSFQILTAGGPGDATTSLNMLAFRNGIQFLTFGRASAIATMMLIIAFTFGKLTLRFARSEES